MDPFTQRILQKAEQRSKALGISKTVKYPLGEIQETVSKSVEPTVFGTNKTGKESTSKIRRQCSSNEDNVDVGIQINITTGPNVEVEIEVQDDNKEDPSVCPSESDSKGECASKIRECSRNRLQRLGALYSNNDLSSPIHRTEGKFHEEEPDSSEASTRRPKQKLGKLVALADAINNWEDDISHPDYKLTKRDNKSEETSYTTDTNSRSTESSSSNNTKHLKWDKNVMDSLEAQGFQRRESTGVKMSYQYENRKGEDKENEKAAKLKSDNTATVVGSKLKHTPSPKSKQQTRFSSIKTGAVSGIIAEFDNKLASPNKQKDPAEMSLKERMMVFEKNKGKALLPKVAFGIPAPVTKFSQKNTKTDALSRKCGPAPPRDFPVDVKVKEKVAALASGSSTISESKIKEDIIKQKQRDMEILAKRFDKQRDVHTSESDHIPPPPPPPMPAQNSSSVNIEGKNVSCNKRRSPGSIDDSKRLKADTKPARLYPILPELESDDNCTTATVSTSFPSDMQRNVCDPYDSEMDSENDEESNESLGKMVLENVRKNASLERKKYKEVRYADTNTQIHYDESSENTSASSECFGEVDDYLDEALCQDESSNSTQRRRSHRRSSRGVTSSDSFYYEKQSPKRYQNYNDNSTEEDETDENPLRSVLTVNPSGNDNTVTLVHTVSFYRRQQSNNSNNSTPARRKQVIQQYERHDENDEKSETSEGSDEEVSDPVDQNAVQERIKYLLDEVCKQQQIIAQTSHALNLCASTIEFSGSTEAVEGERHLLVASHRRQTALDEVQRLKIEGILRPRGSLKEKGRITVNEITVPLRRDYVRRLSTETIAGHHLVCLLKYEENVLATKTISTLPGLLAVKFPDVLQMNNVYADFRVTLEVYGMAAQREVLPHEIKYHINLNKKSGSKTPNKKKAADSRLVMPSLGDSNALRTPALTKYGFAILSLREIRRTTWSLVQLCTISPLEGSVHMKVSYELELSIKHRGFLTMFQDISGFGAWHRRWCLLDGYVLNYWKYPDDENKKAPMGSIDLNNCISPSANLAPRDVCSRLNTILLECQRPAEETDIESLIIIPRGRVTIVRHLLSADTKAEREEWCAFFNKSLTLVRALHGRK